MRRDDRRRTGGLSPLMISLALQVYSHLERSQYWPPVTLALLGLNTLVHLHPDPYFLDYSLASVRQNCIHPRVIVSALQHGELELHRIVFAGFMHADDLHLYYNMLSLCWKGVQLESKMGSAAFLKLVCFSLIVSHSLLVFLAYALFRSGFQDSATGFNTCAIGFSAVLFSLKYVLNHGSPAMTPVFGMMIPSKYAAWVELVLISLITPNASFLGHLAGILAGILYIHSPRSLSIPGPARYTYASGPLNGGSSSRSSSSTNHNMDEDDEIELEEVESLDEASNSHPAPTAERLRQSRLNRFSTTGGSFGRRK